MNNVFSCCFQPWFQLQLSTRALESTTSPKNTALVRPLACIAPTVAMITTSVKVSKI